MPPAFVTIGHLTRDEHPDGDTLGGTATFASVTARNLGYSVAVLTSASNDFPTPERLDGIELHCLPSPTTTTFRNIYHQGKRHQYVRNIAAPLHARDLPHAWRTARIALLGPLVAEVGPDMPGAFSDETIIGVVPQGWMREWDALGRVRPRLWSEAEDILRQSDVLVLSEQDLGEYVSRLDDYVALTPIVVLTLGDKGCTVYARGKKQFSSPAFKVVEVDPTGAGDVFTAAFLIRLLETGDLADSARFANCTASFAVEAEGVDGIPTRAQVEQRLRFGALNT